MFGYIKPAKSELKVREYELFRAGYCGLCRTLGKRYGLIWRFLLNYDFCYLAILLLSANETPCAYCRKNCIASPFRRHTEIVQNAALEYAADATVLLSWYKAGDAVEDERGFKKLVWRTVRLLMKHGWKRARQYRPALDVVFAENMGKLREMEREKLASIDRPADAFAQMLAAASGEGEGMGQRILHEALYHTGRWIYIADAWDDAGEDLREGNYNPIVLRYGLDSAPDGEIAERLADTLELSCANAAQAAELLPKSAFTEIVKNVIYLGMPSAAKAIRAGDYRKAGACKGRNSIHGSI